MLGKVVASVLIIAAILGFYRQFHSTIMFPFVSYMQKAIEDFKLVETKSAEDLLKLWGFNKKE